MIILINGVYQRVFPYVPSTIGISHFDKTYELPDFLRYVNFFIKNKYSVNMRIFIFETHLRETLCKKL
jgi:hypothetical protein